MLLVYLGTRTVSILQFSLGSSPHSSSGMFCTRFLVSSWHSCTEKRLYQLFSAVVAAV